MGVLGTAAWLKARLELRSCLRRLAEVERVQGRVLERLLRRHAESLYGRRFQFGSIRSAQEYAGRVPLVAYDDLAADIARVGTRPRVLSCDPLVQWVYTSGAATAPKLLPHTSASIRTWCRGLARSYYSCMTTPAVSARIFAGKALYDVAPARVHDLAGVPAGYISGVAAQHNRRLRHWESIPHEITRLARHEEKLAALTRWAVTQDITAAGGITSFTYRLLRYVQEHALEVCDDAAAAARLASAATGDGKVDLRRLWPNFVVIGSTGVPVDLYRPLLEELIPGVAVRDTYTASEAAYGFAVDEDEGLLLNADLYYFELADPQGRDEAVPLAQGCPGEAYELVVSASNGLWRYRTGDVVRLLARRPARVRVVGRQGQAVNLSGEKVTEEQVSAALLATARAAGVACSDYFFFGWVDAEALRYCLALEPDRPLAAPAAFAARFADALARENHLFELVRQRARTEVHVLCLQPETTSQVLGRVEVERGNAGHAKVRRITTLPHFCALVGPERIQAGTLRPGPHTVAQRERRGGAFV